MPIYYTKGSRYSAKAKNIRKRNALKCLFFLSGAILLANGLQRCQKSFAVERNSETTSNTKASFTDNRLGMCLTGSENNMSYIAPANENVQPIPYEFLQDSLEQWGYEFEIDRLTDEYYAGDSIHPEVLKELEEYLRLTNQPLLSELQANKSPMTQKPTDKSLVELRTEVIDGQIYFKKMAF